METVLVCVAPEADFDLYELWHRQLHGGGWEALVVPIDEVGEGALPPVAAAVAQATDWPDEKAHEWLARLRQAVGPRKRILALMPKPPDGYPAETQALWNYALGYGHTLTEVVGIVDDILAGHR